jgi:hypothetical protein
VTIDHSHHQAVAKGPSRLPLLGGDIINSPSSFRCECHNARWNVPLGNSYCSAPGRAQTADCGTKRKLIDFPAPVSWSFHQAAAKIANSLMTDANCRAGPMAWKTICASVIGMQLLCFAVVLDHAQGDPGPVHIAQTSNAVLPVGVVPPSLVGPSGGAWENGVYNWGPAYVVASLVFRLEATGDEEWAARIVDWGEQILAGRDAISPTDQRPYAWIDHSSNVRSPYVWIAFTAHNFAPLIEFASYILNHKDLGAKPYRGKSYRDYALAYMHEFTRALDVDMAELVKDGRHAYFRFARYVPVANKKINGAPLPVNMNAAMFSAMLHLAKAEAAAGRPSVAAQLSTLVTGFVAYLKDDVLVSQVCGDRACVVWRYSTYLTHIEDVGHANLTVKFLVDAHNNGYGISRDDLIGIANTFDNLIDSNGKPRGNLLDGSTIAGVSSSIYFVFLLTKYSPSLRTKLGHIIADSRNFSYWGSWLKSTGDGKLR